MDKLYFSFDLLSASINIRLRVVYCNYRVPGWEQCCALVGLHLGKKAVCANEIEKYYRRIRGGIPNGSSWACRRLRCHRTDCP